MNSFSHDLKKKIEEFEDILKPHVINVNLCEELDKAVNYSITCGGKRLRPIIMKEAYKIFNKEETTTLHTFMVGMEFIHNFSLVHDDLPAIDNDELRRGKPTTHKLFGEDIAILTGDVMLNYAYKVAASSFFNNDSIDIKVKAEALHMLIQSCEDMIDGETIDVIGEFDSNKKLVDMYDKKTCKLIISSLCIGALLGGASEDAVLDMGKIGYLMGMAYQIQDDILDIEGDEDTFGKPIGSDQKNNKKTLVSVMGIANAKNNVETFYNEAIEVLEKYTDENNFLHRLLVSLRSGRSS